MRSLKFLAASLASHLTLLIAVFFAAHPTPVRQAIESKILLGELEVPAVIQTRKPARPPLTFAKGAAGTVPHSDSTSETHTAPEVSPSESVPTVIEMGTTAFAEIRKKLDSAIHYPYALRRRGVQGTVLLQLALTAEGSLTDSRILQSSGSETLDQETLTATKRAEPFPNSLKKAVTIQIPVEFKIR